MIRKVMVAVLGVVIVTTVAIIQAVVAICGQHWLHGYDSRGLLAAIISPWRACALVTIPKDNVTVSLADMDCFRMNSWTGTGFGPLEIVQQMEYWSLGAQVIAVLTTLVLSCNQAYHKCYLRLKRPSLILQAIACVLSVVSISVFPAASKSGLLSLTERPTEGKLAWAYWLRLSACVTSFLALALGSFLLRFNVSRAEPADEDTVTFVATEDVDDVVSDQQPMISGSDL